MKQVCRAVEKSASGLSLWGESYGQAQSHGLACSSRDLIWIMSAPRPRPQLLLQQIPPSARKRSASSSAKSSFEQLENDSSVGGNGVDVAVRNPCHALARHRLLQPTTTLGYNFAKRLAIRPGKRATHPRVLRSTLPQSQSFLRMVGGI